MKAELIPEPELQFGSGRHVDIRFGIKDWGPLDFDSSTSPKQIRLGIVGSPQTIEKCKAWLDSCKNGIAAKDTNRPNLFPRFPGFGLESPFKSGLSFDSKYERSIPDREFEQKLKKAKYAEVVDAAVKLFESEIEYLTENTSVDVIVCALPRPLMDVLEPAEKPEDEDQADALNPPKTPRIGPDYPDFHHLLKARVMRFRKPIQLIQPSTYGDKSAKPKTFKRGTVRRLQDDATRAWNFHVALYYKANGIPWRIIRESTELTSCFVGVSFYKSLEGDRVQTSVAQVFSERGEGIIIRGGTASVTKEDRQPHLDEGSACALLRQALERYRSEHQTMPARVVLHKSSQFSKSEVAGFEQAIQEQRIGVYDLVSLGKSLTRLYRYGAYPPLRGTFWSLDAKSHILYTRGSIDFYKTYPGMYVPRPIRFHCERTDQTPLTLAKEILALTKMNWNSTEFDNSEPITLHAARQVGSILKYVNPNDNPEPRYSYYM